MTRDEKLQAIEDSCCVNYHNCNKAKWDNINKDLTKYNIERTQCNNL